MQNGHGPNMVTMVTAEGGKPWQNEHLLVLIVKKKKKIFYFR